jgi:hypothetical protein
LVEKESDTNIHRNETGFVKFPASCTGRQKSIPIEAASQIPRRSTESVWKVETGGESERFITVRDILDTEARTGRFRRIRVQERKNCKNPVMEAVAVGEVFSEESGEGGRNPPSDNVLQISTSISAP